MYYHGEFLNMRGEKVTVRIVTGGDLSATVEIGAEDSPLYFAEDPVEVTTSVNGTGDHLLRSEASVRLLTRDFVPDFFCRNCRDAVVNILKGERCVFAGFIVPQAYSQPYNEVWDELTISCIDALSALQYSRYLNAGQGSVSYRNLKSGATMRSMEEILTTILTGISDDLDISGTSTSHIWYDGSKGMTSAKSYTIFSELEVSELLFLGDEEDEVWTQEEVLTEILKYLNLRMAQDGFDFRIYSWESAQEDAAISWKDLAGISLQSTLARSLTFANANVTDCDTQISVGEVYNRILLTCETEPVETLVESPLDQSAMTSPYSGRQLYMRDYYAGIDEGGDDTSWDTLNGAFNAILAGSRTDYEKAWTRDWLLRVMDHPCWIFRIGGAHANVMGEYCAGNANQQGLPNALAGQYGAALISWGAVKEMAGRSDDSPATKVDTRTTLVVSVNGNGEQQPELASPNPVTLRNMAPVATYQGPSGGTVYSPPDDTTTNYIVFSGKMILNPLRKTSDGLGFSGRWPNRDDNGVHLYAQRFFKAANPGVRATVDTSVTCGLQPFTEVDPATVKYEMNPGGNTNDQIGKVGVLRCMLVIGGKCVVEEGGGGLVTDFTWKPFKERVDCSDDDEYYAQSFTLGFNPAIGDNLINTEFPISNNISYHTGIEAEGTAIPVRRSDALSGQVRFEILGPDPICWNEIGKTVEPWSGAILGWPETKKLLLPLLANILVTDFEVKVMSDNSADDPIGDSDLIYMSDTEESYVNEKDDVTFRIVSALTSDERSSLGVRESPLLSTPRIAATGLGVTRIYDRTLGAPVKPEQAYVDACYKELHLPRVEMEQSVADTVDNVGMFHLYHHPAMPDKTFFALGISRNLREGSARLKLKETWI